MSKRSRYALISVVLLLAYVGSYFVLASRGGWYWSQTGRHRYNFGYSVTDVERWFPACAYWEPFHDISGSDGSPGNLAGYFYSPLIRLDRAWFHPDRLLFSSASQSPPNRSLLSGRFHKIATSPFLPISGRTLPVTSADFWAASFFAL